MITVTDWLQAYLALEFTNDITEGFMPMAFDGAFINGRLPSVVAGKIRKTTDGKRNSNMQLVQAREVAVYKNSSHSFWIIPRKLP